MELNGHKNPTAQPMTVFPRIFLLWDFSALMNGPLLLPWKQSKWVSFCWHITAHGAYCISFLPFSSPRDFKCQPPALGLLIKIFNCYGTLNQKINLQVSWKHSASKILKSEENMSLFKKKTGGLRLGAQLWWDVNWFLIFSSPAINNTDISGNVLLTHQQQMFYLPWLHLNSAKTVLFEFEGKPDYFVLFRIFTFPFLATGLQQKHKCFKSPLL